MAIEIINGDALDVLAALPSQSFDAVITDPPYGIGFMGREWDTFTPAAVDRNAARQRTVTTRPPRPDRPDTPQSPISRSALVYDKSRAAAHRFEAWCETWARECFRILKPGGHLAAFCSPRMSHRLASGVEDAGFEIRDSLDWLFGQGYPKSIDGEREVARSLCTAAGRHFLRQLPPEQHRREGDHVCEATDLSRQFLGIGSALKPAHEPIVLARRPLVTTIGRTLIEHGTGGLHVDAARVGMSAEDVERIRAMGGFGKASYDAAAGVSLSGSADGSLNRKTEDATPHDAGRWPPNVILTHRPECVPAGRRKVKNNGMPIVGDTPATGDVYGIYRQRSAGEFHGGDDGFEDVEAWLCVEGCPVLELDRQSGESDPESVAAIGGASRYFPVTSWQASDLDDVFRYEPKATRLERDAGCEDLVTRSAADTVERKEGSLGLSNPRAGAGRTSGAKNHHPTVKPIGLMRWLVRLLTKPGDRVVDPFLGSGTTAAACKVEGVDCLGIEREPDYVEIASRRIEAFDQPAMLQLAEAEPERAEPVQAAQVALFE